MSEPQRQSDHEKSGLWHRINNWWDGGEAPVPDLEGGAGPKRHLRLAAGEANPVWPAERIEVLAGLFGDGMVAPLGDDIWDLLTGRMDLSDTSRALVLTCGAGGPAARLAAGADAAVVALEDRVEIADIAQNWIGARPETVKFDRRDYFDTGLKPAFANVILATEGLSHVREKKRLFHHLLQIVRPNGLLIFVDFFVTGEDPDCPEVAVWSALEDRPRFLMSCDRLGEIVYDIGFDEPEFVDVTDAYRAAIREGFRRSPDILEAAGDRAMKVQPFLMAEAERWNRQLTLLASGEARVMMTCIEYFGRSAVV